jgi:hypothetical protein
MSTSLLGTAAVDPCKRELKIGRFAGSFSRDFYEVIVLFGTMLTGDFAFY